jgi:hypothetical protein
MFSSFFGFLTKSIFQAVVNVVVGVVVIGYFIRQSMDYLGVSHFSDIIEGEVVY